MRNIKVNESVLNEAMCRIMNEAFCPSADKVLHIKKYLDDNFSRQELDDIDTNGFPSKDKTVVMLSKEKQPIKTMKISDLLMLLDDKFQMMISDKNDRTKFLKQVISDWYYNNITKDGLLSVNFLK